MAIWQLCANLLIPNCLRSNLSYSPLAALELYVNVSKSLNYAESGYLIWLLAKEHKKKPEEGEVPPAIP